MLSQKVEAKPSTTIIFDQNELIEGSLKSPDVDVLVAHKRPIFKSMVKVRENFDDKIVRSVDQM